MASVCCSWRVALPDPPSVVSNEDLLAELVRLRAQLGRERRLRTYRSEIHGLMAQAASAATPRAVAQVVASGFAEIVGSGWVCVAFVDPVNPEMAEFVFGATMPPEVVLDWPTAPLTTDLPMTAVLRGDSDTIELPDSSEFDRWPPFAAESERAMIGSFYCLPIPGATADDTRAAAIGLAWPSPHEIDDDERLLLADIIAASAPAFDRARTALTHRRVSETLQNWLLPPSIPEIAGLDVATLYVPGRDELTVGGDWYDVVSINETTSAFVVGDVVGHNERAAAEMGQVRHVLASNLMTSEGDGALSLQRTDEYFSRRSPDTMATAIVVVVNADAESVTIASAGHLPPVVAAPATACRIVDCPPGPPIGTGLGGYRSIRHPFPHGALLVAFTDGVVERRDEVIDDSLLDLCRAIDRAVVDDARGTIADVPAEVINAVLQLRVADEDGDDDAASLVLRRI
jgi:hypothetical protein